MPIERHQYRERNATTLIDGETPNARQHHAIKKFRLVVSDLLPSGSHQKHSEDELQDLIQVGGPSLRGARVVFIAHGEKYNKVDDSDGKLHTFTHGIDDELENRSLSKNLPALGGNWLEGGSGFSPRRVKHDWQEAPYRDRQ